MGDRDITYWLTFSPDGSKIALSTGFNDVQIIDRKTKKMLHKFTHNWTVYAGVFSPDGKLFAAGDREFVRLRDVGTGKEVRRINAVKGRMGTLAFSPDGKTLAGGGGWLCLWNVATGQVRHLFPTNGDQIRSVAFTRDGKTIASAGDAIRLYDVATKKERLHIPQQAHSLYFSASDEVLTAAVGGAIRRWDTKTGKFLTP
jgi:WD40 repeat protein